MKSILNNHSAFFHKTFNGLADSLIKIFIPVLILKETGNLYYALLFMTIRPIFFVIFNILLKKFLSKHPSLSIILHIVPIIIIQFLIFFTTITLPMVFLLSVLMALFGVFYSVPFNLLFIFSDKKHNVSKMQIGTNVGRILFIIVAGFAINQGTFVYLFTLCIVASLIYILSVVPFVFNENLKEVNTSQGEQVLTKQQAKLLNITHLAFGSFQILMDEVLPVYLFVSGLTFTNIALLQVFIEIGRLLANLSANYLYKKNLSKFVILAFCFLYSASIISILFIKNIIAIYVLSTIIGVAFPMVFVPIFKKFCAIVNGKQDLITQVSNRDNCIFGSRPILIGSYFLGFTFIAPFFMGVVSAITLAINSNKLLKL